MKRRFHQYCYFLVGVLLVGSSLGFSASSSETSCEPQCYLLEALEQTQGDFQLENKRQPAPDTHLDALTEVEKEEEEEKGHKAFNLQDTPDFGGATSILPFGYQPTFPNVSDIKPIPSREYVVKAKTFDKLYLHFQLFLI